MNEQTDERTNEIPPVFYRTLSPSGPLPKNRPERADFRSERAWGDERRNKRTNERKSPCVLQDIVPFGAAAQKQTVVDGLTNRLPSATV